MTLAELDRRLPRSIDVGFERASNRLLYGTDDPAGGNGRQPYPITHPLFPEGDKK